MMFFTYSNTAELEHVGL